MKKKMLMVATVPSMIGQFNMENIQLLLHMGYEVHVACNFKDRSVWTEERVQAFEKQLSRLRVRRIQVEFARSPYDIVKLLKVLHKLRRIIRKQKYQMLHCHTPVAGMAARIAAFKTRTKVIYTAHGFHFYRGAPLKNWLLYYPIEKFCSYLTDILITINKEDYHLAQTKMKAKRVAYIPGVGVDLKKFAQFDATGGMKEIYEQDAGGVPNSVLERNILRESLGCSTNDIVLISVGELNENKNHEVIIKALSEISESRICYWLCGIGDQKIKLETLAKQLKLQDRVRFLGYQTDVAQFLRAADIFCFPSKREGLGLAAIEAMASGLPLITSNVHGINDYSISGVSGYSCKPLDVKQFAKNIQKLCFDQSTREEMGQHNRNSVNQFSVEQVTMLMKKIYSDLTG